MPAIRAAGKSDVGRHRERNEDSYLLFPPIDEHDAALYVVADGMGGHVAGEVASSIAVNTIGSYFRKNVAGTIVDRIREAVEASSIDIYETGQMSGRQGMGSTVVCVVIQGERLVSAHVGDSRVYRLRRGEIERITHDHSWVQAQVDSGVLTPEQAETFEARNIITRALGVEPTVEVETKEFEILVGDHYILCSDGLHGLVKDQEIAEHVIGTSPEEACDRLIALANDRGGPDNVTAIVIEIVEEPHP